MKKSSAALARAAVIAAVYAVCTVSIAPITYGAVQFRIAECLCVLAFFYDEAIVGLTVGCFVANLFSPYGPLDIVLGTAATLVSSLALNFCYKRIANKTIGFLVGVFFPIAVNALVVPISILVAAPEAESYFIMAAQVGFGQAVVILSLGTLLYFVLFRLFKSGVLKSSAENKNSSELYSDKNNSNNNEKDR